MEILSYFWTHLLTDFDHDSAHHFSQPLAMKIYFHQPPGGAAALPAPPGLPDSYPVFAVFNVGQYRRDAAGTYNSFEFFKPDNAEAMKIRRCVVAPRPFSLICAAAHLTWLYFFFPGPALSPPCRTCASTSAGTWARWWWVFSSFQNLVGIYLFSKTSRASQQSSATKAFCVKQKIVFFFFFFFSPGVWRHQHHAGAAGRHPGLCQRKRLQGAAVFPGHTSAWEIVAYFSFNFYWSSPPASAPAAVLPPQIFFVESICDDPDIIAENIKVSVGVSVCDSVCVCVCKSSHRHCFWKSIYMFLLSMLCFPPVSKWSSAAPTTSAVTRRRRWPTSWRGSTATRWPTCRWTTTRTGLELTANINTLRSQSIWELVSASC